MMRVYQQTNERTNEREYTNRTKRDKQHLYNVIPGQERPYIYT